MSLCNSEKEIEHKEKSDTPRNPLFKRTDIQIMWTVEAFLKKLFYFVKVINERSH